MHGLLLKGPRKIEVVTGPVPEPEGDEVLIRVHNIGLCGSDIHLYNGTYAGPRNYPMFFGHEWAGIVESRGPDAGTHEVGDHVTGDCSIWCGSCKYCEVDRNLCEKIEKYGITRDGSSREFIVRPERYLYKAPPQVDPMIVSLAEPLAVACHAVSSLERQKGWTQDKRILILGGGTIGLSCLMVLKKIFGCDSVALYDPVVSRMELAGKLGAEPAEDLDSVDKAANGVSVDYDHLYSDLAYDVVFEATGAVQAFCNAMRLVKSLGTIVTLGFIPAETIALKLLTLKAIMIMGSIGGTGEFPRVLGALGKDPSYFAGLISHRFHYLDYQNAFQAAADRSSAIKVQVYFGND